MKKYGFLLKILSVVLAVTLIVSIFPFSISMTASTSEHENAVTLTVMDEDNNPVGLATVNFTVDSIANGNGYIADIKTADEYGTVEIMPSDSFVADDMTLNATVTKDGYEDKFVTAQITDSEQDIKVILKEKETIIVTAANGEYTGKEVDAVSVSGTQDGDVVTYKLGDGEFTREIPKIKDEGTYKVTVKVVRDGDTVFEKEVEVVVTASTDILVVGGYSATAYSGVFNGVAHEAVEVTATSPDENDKVEYKLGDAEFSEEVPMITNAGTYKVTVRVTREGYDPKEIELQATISTAEQDLEFANEYYHDGATLSVAFEGSQAWYDFSVKDADESVSYSVTVLQGANATISDEGTLMVSGTGCYEIKATKSASANYNAKSIIFTLVVTKTDEQLISFEKDAVDYTFGMNDGVIAEQTTDKKYAADTDEVKYKITEGYGVEVDKSGKVTVKDYDKLSEKLDEEDEVKVVVTATKPEHKTYVNASTKPQNKNKNTVYFTNNKNWGSVYVHYWGGASQTQWPGVAMESAGNNHLGESLYKYDIPKDCTSVVFHNNAGEQTIDVVGISDNTGYYLTNKTGANWGVDSYKAQFDDYTQGAVETVYKESTASYVITIKTIDTPENAYTVVTQPNDLGWYNQGVEITPAEGYKIALSAGDEFSDSVTITQEGIHSRVVYLQSQAEDTKGAITKKVSVGEMKIDTTAPDLNKNMTVEYKHKFSDIILETFTLGFYDSGIIVEVSIDDENSLIESGISAINWKFIDKDTQEVKDSGVLEHDYVDGKYVAKLYLDANEAKQYRGNLIFTATDIAGNTSNEYPSDEKDRPDIILDSIAPTCVVNYNDPVEVGSAYYDGDIKVDVEITEYNFDENDVKVFVIKDGAQTQLDSTNDISWSKKVVDGEDVADTYVGTFTLTEDGAYKVAVKYTDKSSNEMEPYTSDLMIIDTKKPVLVASYSQPSNEANNMLYYNSNIDVTFDLTEVNFFAEDVIVKVVKDGKEIPVDVNWSVGETADKHIGTFTLTNDGVYSVVVDYTDRSKNVMDTYSSDQRTIDKIKPVINVVYSNQTPENILEDSDGNNRQYFGDTQVATITITERNFNGADITIASNNVSGDAVSGTYVETDWTSVGDAHTKTITYNGDANFTFDISCTDFATNVSDKYDTDYFTVDKTAPNNLTVSYSTSVLDTILEGLSFGFYNSKVKVTITADDDTSPIHAFKYDYKKAAGVSSVNHELLAQLISDVSISYSQGNKTATAVFEIPREALSSNNQFNGTVNFTAADRAENSSDKKDNKRIVVDNIAPVCDVTFNQHVNQSNGVYYFDGNINATIRINEANFYAQDVNISVTKDGASFPVSPRWTDESVDVHVGTFTLSQDGDYVISVTYTDKSGNQMTAYESDQLTIDTQIEEPVFSINGVSKKDNGGAYKGKADIAFNFNDENFDTHSVKLVRTRFDKVEDVTSKFVTVRTNANGGSGSFSIKQITENDGIYVLTVSMTDKARHSAQAQLKFTINRFGSVYEYSDSLVELIKNGGQYVKSVKEDLVIKEYNADKLTANSLEIFITRDGKPIEVAYSCVPEKINSAVKIGASGWYEYVYTLKASNFEQDGVYKISLASEYSAVDSKKNSSMSMPENSMAADGSEILDTMRFTVDDTAPEIRNIINLESSIVNAQTLNVKYNIIDVGGIKSIEVILNGKVIDTITKFEDMFNYTGEFVINESSDEQSVQFRITDLAGNVTDTDDESFSTKDLYVFNKTVTVSTNFFVRFYANKLLFWGTIGGVVLLMAVVIFIIAKKRKKNNG